MASKSKLVKSTTTNKEFKYSNGNVNLNFTLGIDNSSELRAFNDLLKTASADIEEMLKEYKN